MITLPHSVRMHISPLANLTPQSLSRQLDEFSSGYFSNIARTWEAIEQRDDILKAVSAKRKKAPARLPWQLTSDDASPEALAQKSAVETMLKNLQVGAAHDRTVRGGLPLLIEMLMDAVGKRYSCLELRFQRAFDGQCGAQLQFVPLWHFERKDAQLMFAPDADTRVPVDPAQWIVAVGDGLMEASSIAYLYKHLPLRDWLIYCERNGMPGVKGTTDAQPGTPEWENARRAVEEFGAEFSALLTRGASLEAIDLSTKGTLPYPALVERMDQAIVALWRGSDLTTISADGTGASLQKGESALIEEHDASWTAEVLNTQLIAPFVRFAFGPAQTPLVRINLQPPAQLDREIAIFTLLKELNLPIPAHALYERLGLEQPPLASTQNTTSAKI